MDENFDRNFFQADKLGRKVKNLVEKLRKEQIYYLRAYKTINALSDEENIKAILDIKSTTTAIICTRNQPLY